MTANKWIQSVLGVVVVSVGVGCSGVPLKSSATNRVLFESQGEFKTRCAQLQPTMSRDEVFTALGVSQDAFTALKPVEIQQMIYGQSEVQGTPAQLEEFRVRMAAYEGLQLPYREIRRSGKLGIGKVIIDEKGWDQTLVLIFDNGTLFKAMVAGRANVDENSSTYVWEFVGDAVRKGGKLALK